MPQQPMYFCRRIASFQADGLEPPAHLRMTLTCDTCREKCWANRDSFNSTQRKYAQVVICDVCMRNGRHVTG